MIRRRAGLLVACGIAAGLGVATKHWTGPGHDLAVGQGEDLFGTVFLVLALRLLRMRAPMWQAVAPVLAILTAIEISQAFHGELLDRARSTWLGLHVLGSTFGWGDLLAYALGAAVAAGIDRRLATTRAG